MTLQNVRTESSMMLYVCAQLAEAGLSKCLWADCAAYAGFTLNVISLVAFPLLLAIEVNTQLEVGIEQKALFLYKREKNNGMLRNWCSKYPGFKTVRCKDCFSSIQLRGRHIVYYSSNRNLKHLKLDMATLELHSSSIRVSILKQVPRNWYKLLKRVLKGLKLEENHKDPCVYFNVRKLIYLVIYADDMILCYELAL
jgi:hypothetical protein